jgi:hypothetical protein
MTPDQTEKPQEGDEVADCISRLRQNIADDEYQSWGQKADIETLIRAAEENAGLRYVAEQRRLRLIEKCDEYEKLALQTIRLLDANNALHEKFPEPQPGWKWVQIPVTEDPWHGEGECETCAGLGVVGGFCHEESGYQEQPCPACNTEKPVGDLLVGEG